MPKVITRFQDLLDAIASGPGDTRQLIAIVGPPGSGKSTLSEALNERLTSAHPGTCAILPMDGFHYDDDVLRQNGLLERKGAPQTFDIGGLIHLHRRLAANLEPDIAVPLFDRSRELSRAGARLIDQSVHTVLVEGNYLLLQEPGWQDLKAFYSMTVQISVSENELEQRLVQRWRDHGFSEADALQRTRTNDLVNARLVNGRSAPADLRYDMTSIMVEQS